MCIYTCKCKCKCKCKCTQDVVVAKLMGEHVDMKEADVRALLFRALSDLAHVDASGTFARDCVREERVKARACERDREGERESDSATARQRESVCLRVWVGGRRETGRERGSEGARDSASVYEGEGDVDAPRTRRACDQRLALDAHVPLTIRSLLAVPRFQS